MDPLHQYQDLTEIIGTNDPLSNIYEATGTTKAPAGGRWDSPRKLYTVDLLETEFAFAVDVKDSGEPYLQQNGFKKISSCTNWWPSHDDSHRKLSLWWMENPKAPNLKSIPVRRSWCDRVLEGNKYDSQWEYTRLGGRMASSGCGMMLDEAKEMPKDGTYWKFFCLLRQPVKPDTERLEWLKKLHFKHIVTGMLASYWHNGYNDKTWSEEKEIKRWGNWASWEGDIKRAQPHYTDPKYMDILKAQQKYTTEKYALESKGPWLNG